MWRRALHGAASCSTRGEGRLCGSFAPTAGGGPSPLRRSEAISAAHVRETLVRVSTDNIGLARHGRRSRADSHRLAASPRFAAWRYGRHFGTRRQRSRRRRRDGRRGPAIAGLALGPTSPPHPRSPSAFMVAGPASTDRPDRQFSPHIASSPRRLTCSTTASSRDWHTASHHRPSAPRACRRRRSLRVTSNAESANIAVQHRHRLVELHRDARDDGDGKADLRRRPLRRSRTPAFSRTPCARSNSAGDANHFLSAASLATAGELASLAR